MGINNPLILIGAGRCGSTIIHETLTLHKNITYLDYRSMLSGYSVGFHRFIMGLQNFPLIGDTIRSRNYACEDYNLWNRYYKGFGDTFRDLEAADVTVNAKEGIREFFSTMLTPSRQNIVIKITGWGRVGFLKEVFPDAKFVHILRDGRGNANSLLEVDFWKGWKGTEHWNLGSLRDNNRKIWEESNFSYVTLAGLYWKIVNQKIDSEKKKYIDDFKTIKYEDFCASPSKVMKEITDFAGLPFTAQFEKSLGKKKIVSKNFKWKENLTEIQLRDLELAINELQENYGYE